MKRPQVEIIEVFAGAMLMQLSRVAAAARETYCMLHGLNGEWVAFILFLFLVFCFIFFCLNQKPF